MKKVLLSVHPKWCELIFNGKKTIEVRKNIPKLEPPFEVLVYCTMPKERWSVGHQIFFNDTLYTLPTGELKLGDALELIADWPGKYDANNFLNGKVIGSFFCDRINEIYQCNSGWVKENACLSRGEFFDYLGIPRDTHGGYDKKAFGWHITEPKLFDKPKELGEFYIPCKWYEKGKGCHEDCALFDYEGAIDETDDFCLGKRPIPRPPQSWCYVEEN